MTRKIFWCDVETTGLSDNSLLLEIAVVITDLHLNKEFIYTAPINNLYGNDKRAFAENDYVRDMHERNGLWDDVKYSSLSSLDINNGFGSVFDDNVEYILGGNSVHFDRSVLKRYLPAVESRLHYRNLDVSSIAQLFETARPSVNARWRNNKTTTAHRALPDILQSIQQYAHYMDYLQGITKLATGGVVYNVSSSVGGCVVHD